INTWQSALSQRKSPRKHEMKRKGWLWFGSVQAAGICCLLIPASFLQYVGGFLLLPGSLVPFLLSATMREPVLHATSFKAAAGIAGIMVTALSWRSTAQIVRDQGLT